MNQDSALIQWKTNAWTQPEMVAWYVQSTSGTAGTNPLKNTVEINLIERQLVGEDILDIGIGTGRASIPLARKGLRVTGIDSSQAMLDETRRQAGDTPMTLLPGDVLQLPVPDQAFDTVISLNVLVHFPHWREILSAWKRTVRPGGRIIFDIHSLDHLETFFDDGATIDSIVGAGNTVADFGRFTSTARSRDIAEWATSNGMRIVAITPYSGLFGGGNTNLWLHSLEKKHSWKRFLSWLPHDPSLFDFCLFIEEEIIARLTSRATFRFMVTLENTADPEANRHWCEAEAQRNRLLANLHDAAELKQIIPLDQPEFAGRLEHYLGAPRRNRAFLYLLLAALKELRPGLDLIPSLPSDIAGLFSSWREKKLLDDKCISITETWDQPDRFDQEFSRHDTPLAPSMKYLLMEDLLTQYHHTFTGERS